MSNGFTWTSWSIKIGNKAYKGIQPLAMEIGPSVDTFSNGYLWWRKTWTEPNGKWYIQFTYDEGPLTRKKTDYIYFDKESDARAWYDVVFNGAFLGNANVSVPPPPTPSKPTKSKDKNGLHLV